MKNKIKKNLMLFGIVFIILFLTQISATTNNKGYETYYYKDGKIAATYYNGAPIEKYIYNDNEQIIQTPDTQEITEYNDEGYATNYNTYIDSFETSTSYNYSEAGNLQEIKTNIGEHIFYNDKGDVIKYTDKYGNVWEYKYEYDENNTIISVTEIENGIEIRTYYFNQDGSVAFIQEGKFSYAPEYNENGIITSLKLLDETGKEIGSANFNYEEVCSEQNESGGCRFNFLRFKGIEDYGVYGSSFENKFDEKGNIVEQKINLNEPDLTEEENIIGFNYTYDDENNLIEDDDFKYIYDEEGKLTKMEDKEFGTIYNLEYDDLGYIASITAESPEQGLLGAVIGWGGGNWRMNISYNSYGEKVKYIKAEEGSENVSICYYKTPDDDTSIVCFNCNMNNETNPDKNCNGNIDLYELVDYFKIYNQGKISADEFAEAKEKWEKSVSIK